MIFFISFLFPILTYISYGILILLLTILKKKEWHAHVLSDINSEPMPRVSLVFPTYNEEKIIVEKIKNIYNLDYPMDKLEIIIVDDSSEDKTFEILKTMQRSNIKIIRHTNRQGYNNAMIDGMREAIGDIIVITDAGALLNEKTLKKLLKHFTNPSVGAVTGRQKLIDSTNGIGSKLEECYSKFYNSIRKRESIIDSTFDTKGEISAFRRDILDRMFDPRLKFKGTIDIYLGFFTRFCGFKVIYEEDAIFYEYAPFSINDWFMQKINRATIVLDTISEFKNMILNKRFGLFGLIILPFRCLILFVNPILFLISILLAIYTIFILPTFAFYFWITIFFLAIIISLTSKFFVLSFSISQLSLIIALSRIILGRKKSRVIWKKIPSTRRKYIEYHEKSQEIALQ